jgi:hypothetical protein
MKTITLNTRLKKIENISRGSKAYQIVKAFINNESNSMIFGNIIIPCRSRRFKANLNYTHQVIYLLDKIGMKYKFGNDSARGGKSGNFIKITSKIS